MRNPKDLITMCEGKKVYIQTHNFPDPDAIASAFGLSKLLQVFNIPTVLCHEGQIDKLSSVKLLNLCGIEMHAYDDIKDSMKEEDMIILVDCQKENGNTTDFVGDEVAVIDHHPTFKEISYQYRDLQITGACASLIADYYRMLGLDPEMKVATALLYGIRMDTLQLSRGTTSFDIQIYGYLFRYASDELLTALESNNMEFNDLTAYGSAIDNISVYGKVGFSYIDFDCPDGLIATLSEFILSLIEVEIAVVYSCRDRGYKFSTRSERKELNAGDLIHTALDGIGNGGGHATMAGGFVPKANLDALGQDTFRIVQARFIDVLKTMDPDSLK